MVTNLQSLVNGSNLSLILAFVTENAHFFFHFSIEKKKEKREGLRCCVRYYKINWRTGADPKKGHIFFRQGIKKNEILYGRTQKKEKTLSTPPQTKQAKGEFFHLFCIVLAAWPSGKAGDCKSFFPSSNLGVAWSTNDKTRNPLFCLAGLTRRIFSSKVRDSWNFRDSK